jgi:hypothetical protein
MRKFISAIESGQSVEKDINGEAGARTVAYMQSIVDNVKLGSGKT